MFQSSPVKCKQMQANGRLMDDMTCIIDCGQIQSLYLGNMESASNLKSLEKYKITAILSICMTKIPFTISSQMKYYQHIYLEDSENENIYKYFNMAFDFIERGRQSGNVLVHCMAGISRSAVIIAAYLMKKHLISAKEALQQLERKRWQVYPNDGFLKQLIQYENDLNKNIKEKQNNWFGKILSNETSEHPQRMNSYHFTQKEVENEYQKIRKKYLEKTKQTEQKTQSSEYLLQQQRKNQLEIINNGMEIQIKRLQISDNKKNIQSAFDHKQQQLNENERKKQQLMTAINNFGSKDNPYEQLRLETTIYVPKKQEFKNKLFPNTTRNDQIKLESSLQNYQAKLDNLLNQFGKKSNYYQK